MDNGTSPEVVAQFNRLARLPDQWDHNRQYQKYLLRRVGEHRGDALDVGCGTGEFTRELASRCRRVTGIDVADCMIEEAQKRNTLPNIEYLKIDAIRLLRDREKEFDVIVSIATLHHLDVEAFFNAARRALRPGGVLLVLDLFKTVTPADMVFAVAGVLCNPLWNLVKRGGMAVTEEEREAWKEHARCDSYDTLARIRDRAAACLGRAAVRRHLFWRYSLVYNKAPVGSVSG